MATSTEKNTPSPEKLLGNRVTRLTKAHDLVKNHTFLAGSVGFIPIPLIDIAALSTIQLKMLYSLARRYKVPFSKNVVKSLITSLIGGSASVSIALPLGSFFKAIPIIGQTSGMISTSLIGSASTYAIGKIFIAHFESGGTFLDFDVERARTHFKELYDEGKRFVNTEENEKANK